MFTSFRKSLSSFRLILLSLFLSAFRRQVWIQLQGDVRKSFQVSVQPKHLNTFCCTWRGGNPLLKALSHLSSCCKSAWAPWAAHTTSPSAPTEHNGASAEGKWAVIQLIMTREKLFTIWPRLEQLSLPCRSFWPQPETVWLLFYGRKYILLQTVKRG